MPTGGGIKINLSRSQSFDNLLYPLVYLKHYAPHCISGISLMYIVLRTHITLSIIVTSAHTSSGCSCTD